MKKTLMIAAAAAFVMAGMVTAPAAAHANALAKCKACHHLDSDKKKVGPGLKGVFGRAAGTMGDMKYSKSLANGGWTWDAAHLEKWVCNSKDAIKEFTGDDHAKTKMPPQKKCGDAAAEVVAALKAL